MGRNYRHPYDGCGFLWDEFQVHARDGMGIWFLRGNIFHDSCVLFAILFFQAFRMAMKTGSIFLDQFNTTIIYQIKIRESKFMRKLLLCSFTVLFISAKA